MNSVFQRNGRGTGLIMTPKLHQSLARVRGSVVVRELNPLVLQGTKPGHEKRCNLPRVSDRLDEKQCPWLLRPELFALGHVVSAWPCLFHPGTSKPGSFQLELDKAAVPGLLAMFLPIFGGSLSPLSIPVFLSLLGALSLFSPLLCASLLCLCLCLISLPWALSSPKALQLFLEEGQFLFLPR